MFKVWSIIILGVTMLGAGMAVMSVGNRGPTEAELRYVGTWQCVDGSGERAELAYNDRSFQLSVAGASGNGIVTCTSGNLQGDHIVFRNVTQRGDDSQQPCAYVTIKALGDRLVIEGYSAGPRIFERARPR